VAPVAESAKKSAPADKTNPSTSPAPETDPKKSAEKKTEFLTGTRTLHGMSITIPSTPPSQT
jgi:hypothetical protein